MDRFARYAWLTLAYNVAVILWGGIVRASGSGAGCGSHWPLCNGEMLPRAPRIETIIELSHRLTSGIALILVVVLVVRAFRARPRGHPVRRAAVFSLIFILTEAAVGAGLVLFELVADNQSMARALFMATHLINTFLLVGAMTLTAHFASGGAPFRFRGQGVLAGGVLLGVAAVLLSGVSGAVAALGDTLFPATSLTHALEQDLSSTAHLLIRLRVFHPVIAVAAGLVLLWIAAKTLREPHSPEAGRFAWWTAGLVAVQLLAGLVNVLLLAPIWLQIVHLLLADLLWIAFLRLGATTLAERREEVALGAPAVATPLSLLILLAALAAACAPQPVTSPPAAGEAFLRDLDALRREREIPGLSVAVVKDQTLILAQGLGIADLEKETPATAETPYNIASVSKPISAVVALKLAEAGVLNLDRPIAEYSQWGEFCKDFTAEPSLFSRDLRCEPPVHTLRHLLSHTATGVPGERFSYNPIVYSWASRPLMALTEKPFSSLVDQYVFQPAKMTRSARKHRDLPLPADLEAALAPPHRKDEAGRMVRAPALQPQGDGAAGGVISTVLDLAKFDMALDRGELISAKSRELMMTPVRSSQGQAQPYGLGWFVEDYEGHRLVWHSGLWENAYSALYLKVPEKSVTLILLANSDGIWWDNALDKAEVEKSPFAQLFLSYWVRN